MSSSKIGMFYSTTTKSQYQQLSKPKNTIHPQIIKIMQRPNNALKPISKELQTLALISSKTMTMKKNAALAAAAAATVNNDFIMSDIPQNKKSFSMNFSQLSTGKPCSSCGGR